MTNAQDRLRQAIDHQQDRLRADVPLDRQAAILAILRLLDQLPAAPDAGWPSDLVTGRRIPNLGEAKALLLCLEASGKATPSASTATGELFDGWAARFLQACADVAEAELVLVHGETGFMRLVEDGDQNIAAWIATRRAPTSWLERADIDWWAAFLAEGHEPALRDSRQALADGERRQSDIDTYRRLADVHLRTMAYQLCYPPDAVIGACPIQTYRDVLGCLIAWARQARDRGEPTAPQSERSLIAALSSALSTDPSVIAQALPNFTLAGEGAAGHAAVPGVAAPPLVRLGPDQLVWSLHGLTSEPFFFLTRELRRRDAQAYHNTAYLREEVFRQDLYALFADRRFVTSAGRVKLRRDDGDVRTDLDAVIFDRKSGTLGLFELKSQDPFARSTAELTRQRDNVRYANRQVSGALTWLKRHGGDDLLRRIDPRTARTFRVQKVFPFVLGRYLVHFSDGPPPDPRAAWGTWPQLLRLLDGQPIRASDANPIASLFTRLTNDTPGIAVSADAPARVISLGSTRLTVYPSYAAFQAETEEKTRPFD